MLKPPVTGNFIAFVCFSILLFSGCSENGENPQDLPIANAGVDRTVLTGDTVSLDGAETTGGTNYLWVFKSKPGDSAAIMADESTLAPSFIPDVEGSYEVELSVDGGASTDTVIVSARRFIVSISADPDSAVRKRTRFGREESVVNLNQAGGRLISEGSRGPITSYMWEQISGPSVDLTSPADGPEVEFTGPSLDDFLSDSEKFIWKPLSISEADTRLIFRLTVGDSEGNSESGEFEVWVEDEGEEIKTATGQPNAAVGTTVYLSGAYLTATGSPALSWRWELDPPGGSSAVFANTGSLTSSIRTPKFVPDLAGTYGIGYRFNESVIWRYFDVTAQDWAGVGTVGGSSPASYQCGACHDGSEEEDILTGWQGTDHAKAFENSIGLYSALAPEPYLWQYHTLGYDTSASSVNGGFDDVAAELGFSFPESGLSYEGFVSGYPSLAGLTGVQCESCHGPGRFHSGDPHYTAAAPQQQTVCGQCHGDEEEQYTRSGHESDGFRGTDSTVKFVMMLAQCKRCHTSDGYITYLESGRNALSPDDYSGAYCGNCHTPATYSFEENGQTVSITCQACHEPHEKNNGGYLRRTGTITMNIDGSSVDAGKAASCYDCHNGFYAYDETYCDSNNNGTPDSKCLTPEQTATKFFRQVHFGTQAEVLEGKGAITDIDGDGNADFTLTENSFHTRSTFTLAGLTGDPGLSAANDKCLTCHKVFKPGPNDDGYNRQGGHTFAMGNGGRDYVEPCLPCHKNMSGSFNRLARGDYDGDGSQEGVQDEVKGLLLALSEKIKGLDTANINQSSGTTGSGGIITAAPLKYTGGDDHLYGGNCSQGGRNSYQECNFIDTSDTLKRAVWNHNLIANDGSAGIHNAAFAIQVLQKTYTAVSEASGGNSFKEDYPNSNLR